MTVPLTGAGSLFSRIGTLGIILNDINALSGGPLTVDGIASEVTATLVTKIAAVEADYAAGTAQEALIQGAVSGLSGTALQVSFASYQDVHTTFKNALKTLAQNTLIKMVQDDSTAAVTTLSQALTILIQQMVGASASVKANVPALGAQTSVGSPVGTSKIIGTLATGKGTYSGVEYALAEVVRFVCSADAITGGATADQETFTVTGQTAETDPLAWDWPKGSGTTLTLQVVDPTQDNSGGNVLQNSGWDLWTTASQPPDNWNQLAGVRDTDYAKETSIVFASSPAALKIIGGTGLGVSLAQTFNTTPLTTPGAGGTAYNILTQTERNFIGNYWIKADVVPAAGVFTVDLIDGSGSVIADDAGTNNTFAVTLSGITTSYVNKSFVFRLPANVPTIVKLRVRASTAVSAGSNIYVDDLAFTPATGLYSTTPPYYGSGPQFAIFRGATKPLAGDTWTEAVTISAAGAVQRLAQKFWNLATLGYALPSKADASETVADSVIS